MREPALMHHVSRITLGCFVCSESLIVDTTIKRAGTMTWCGKRFTGLWYDRILNDSLQVALVPSPVVVVLGFERGVGDGAHRDRLAGARDRWRCVRGRADLCGADAAVAAVRARGGYAGRSR